MAESTPPDTQRRCCRQSLEGFAAQVRARGQALGLDAELIKALLQPEHPGPAGGARGRAGGGEHRQEALPSPSSSSGTAPEPRSLVFFHDCQHLGCADPLCSLCANNPQRKCASCFVPKYFQVGKYFQVPKYFQGAVLTAGCGAPLCVAAVRERDGSVVEDLPRGLQLEAFLVNNRLFEAEQPPGRDIHDRLAASQLLKNAKGSNLLLCGTGAAQQPSGTVRMPLQGAAVPLPELRVDGSSEGLLGSKLWGYRLAVRVLDASGAPLRSIQPALSDQMIVTTTRVKGSVKPAVPLTTDTVGKLNGIGDKMAAKLAQTGELLAGLDVDIPQGGIRTVADYRALVAAADRSPKLAERVVAALGLQKGWEEARRHALAAVQPDFLLRAWFADPALGRGLLFKAHLGAPLLDRPAAICHAAADGTLAVSGLVGTGTQEVLLWRQQGRTCWALPSHPGWGLLQMAVEEFEAAVPPGSGGNTLLPAELAVPCRQEVMARLVHMPPPDQLLAQGPSPAAAGACAPPPGVGGTAAAPPAAVTEQLAPPSPAQQVLEALAAAPAGPEGHAAAAAAWAGGGPGEQEQEPLASPYETAMRLPSLPLLGDMFPSLPKEVEAMESLQNLLQGDASLLPMLSALAADRAAAMRGGGGGYDVHAVRPAGQGGQQAPQPEAMPSLLLQLFASLEQQQRRRPGSGQQAQQEGGGEAALHGGGGGGAGVGEHPSWIPSGLFGQESGTGEGKGGGEVPMAVSLRPAAFGSIDMPTPHMGLQEQASGRMGQLLASMSLDR